MSVFVVQQQMRFNKELSTVVPRFDGIEAAAVWGELIYLLSPSAHAFQPDLVVGDLHQKLKTYNDSDYLVLVGNPCLIGMATSVAAYYNEGRVNFLQWSGKKREYLEIKSKIF